MANRSASELLELLRQMNGKPKEKKQKASNSNVLEYLKEMNFKPGTDLVPTYVLFYHYRMIWKPSLTGKSSKIDFFRTLNTVINEQHRHSHQRYYKLNADPLKLTPEDELKALEYDKRHWKKKSSL